MWLQDEGNVTKYKTILTMPSCGQQGCALLNYSSSKLLASITVLFKYHLKRSIIIFDRTLICCMCTPGKIKKYISVYPSLMSLSTLLV